MLNSLTSFRFFAAFLVYLWHVGYLSEYQTGYIGVAFFYVLSGFILTYSYHNRLTNQKESIIIFYIARIAKIYPLHILTFSLSIPIIFLTDAVVNVKLALSGLIHLLLLQSYVPKDGFIFMFNGVAWSISNELFFYLLFPLLLLFLIKFRNKTKLLTGIGLLWFVILIGMSFHEAKVDEWFAYIFPVVRIIEFIVGMGVGLAFVSISNSAQNVKLNINKSTLIEAGSLILLMIAIIFSVYVPQSLRFGLYYVPFMALIIFVFAFQKGYISKLLSNRKLVFLGEVSFSFYMIHNLVLRYLDIAGLSHSISIYVGFIVSLVLSMVLYQWFEEPLRERIKNRYKKSVKQKNEVKTVGYAK